MECKNTIAFSISHYYQINKLCSFLRLKHIAVTIVKAVYVIGKNIKEDRRQRRVEKTISDEAEKVAGSTSPLTKGKRGRERS